MKNKSIPLAVCAAVLFGLVQMAAPPVHAEEIKPYILYRFNDEDGKDEGTAHNDAAAVGTPKYGVKADTEAGPAGKYLIVDSNEDYLLAPGQAFDFGAEAFTTSFWVKFAQDYPVNLGERFFQTGVWGPNDPGYVIAINRDGGGNVSIGTAVAGVGDADPAGSWSFTTINRDFFDESWHLITIVFDQPNKQYLIYLDGVEVGSKGVVVDSLDASSARPDVGIGLFYFNGEVLHRPTYLLDDVAFYKEALTSAHIAAYYEENRGAAVDNGEGVAAERTLVDDLSGTSIRGLGLQDATMYVSPVLTGSAYEQLLEAYGSFDAFMLYHVAIENAGVPVVFGEEAVVQMAIPEKMQAGTDIKAVRVKEDGTIVTIPAMRAGEFLEFRTKELGHIALVSESAGEEEQPVSETAGAPDAPATPDAQEPSSAKSGMGTILVSVLAVVLLGGLLLLFFRKKQPRS